MNIDAIQNIGYGIASAERDSNNRGKHVNQRDWETKAEMRKKAGQYTLVILFWALTLGLIYKILAAFFGRKIAILIMVLSTIVGFGYMIVSEETETQQIAEERQRQENLDAKREAIVSNYRTTLETMINEVKAAVEGRRNCAYGNIISFLNGKLHEGTEWRAFREKDPESLKLEYDGIISDCRSKTDSFLSGVREKGLMEEKKRAYLASVQPQIEQLKQMVKKKSPPLAIEMRMHQMNIISDMTGYDNDDCSFEEYKVRIDEAVQRIKNYLSNNKWL